MAKDKVIPSNLVLCNEKFKYDNIEQMVNDTGLQLDNVVELLGYYKAGDGAGHQRIVASEDDGSGVQLGNGLYANIIHNGEVNVSWFGAKGDGVTDDTQVIQKAITLASIINFDDKTYVTTNTVSKQNSDTLIINANNSTINCLKTLPTLQLLKIKNIEINNLNIDYTNTSYSSNTCVGIDTYGCDKVIINNTNVMNYTFNSKPTSVYGINIVSTDDNQTLYDINNCNFINLKCLGDKAIGTGTGTIRGVLISRSTNNTTYTIGNGVIRNCCFEEIENIDETGIAYTEDADGIQLNVAKVVDGNIYYGDGNAIIKDCYFKNVGKRCIKLQAQQCVVENITVEDTKNINRQECIAVFGNKHSIRNITGNYNNASAVYAYITKDLLIENISLECSSSSNNEYVGRSYFSFNSVEDVKIVNSNIASKNTNVIEMSIVSYEIMKNNISLTNCLIDGNLLYINSGADNSTKRKIDIRNCELYMLGTFNSNSLFGVAELNIYDSDIIINKEGTLTIYFDKLINSKVEQTSKNTSDWNLRMYNELKNTVFKSHKSIVQLIAVLGNNAIVDNVSCENEVSAYFIYCERKNNLSVKNSRIKGLVRLGLEGGYNFYLENLISDGGALVHYGGSSTFRSKLYYSNIKGTIPTNSLVDKIPMYDDITSQLDTPAMQYAMELEGVKQDYLEYSLEKLKYDKQLEAEQQAKQEAYELLLKDNPNLTWEEFEQQYGSNVMMNLSLVERLEEPTIPESVKKFMEKYL